MQLFLIFLKCFYSFESHWYPWRQIHFKRVIGFYSNRYSIKKITTFHFLKLYIRRYTLIQYWTYINVCLNYFIVLSYDISSDTIKPNKDSRNVSNQIALHLQFYIYMCPDYKTNIFGVVSWKEAHFNFIKYLVNFVCLTFLKWK